MKLNIVLPMKEITLKIPNMKCMGCSASIEAHVGRIGGVEHVKTDIPSQTVIITYNGDKSIKTLVLKTLEGIGYSGEEI